MNGMEMSVDVIYSTIMGSLPDPMEKTIPALHAMQEEWIRNHAAQSGSWGDLVYFLAVQRDWNALVALRTRIPQTDRRGRLTLELMFLSDASMPVESLEEQLEGETDIWMYYSLAKHYLKHQQLAAALRVAKASMNCDVVEGMCNSCVLNLIICFLIHNGETSTASQLISTALKRNPHQTDLKELLARAKDGKTESRPLYLDVLPRAMPVSYYVPLYNGEKTIRNVLVSLLNQTYPLYEVLVVDDGSTDQGPDIVREFPVRLITHEQNLGLATARNTAFQVATGLYVGALDADVIADPNMLKYMVMETENPPGNLAGVNARLFEQYTDTPADKWRAAHLNQDTGPQRIAPIESMSGAKTLFLREAVLEVGGYDPRYRTNYEDVSLCKKMRAAGYDLVATPYAFAGHLRQDTPQSILKTSWNYAFWACFERGYYDSREQVVELLTRTLRMQYEVIRWDLEHENAHLLYLDYLNIFVNAFCDIAFSGQNGVFTLGEVRAPQEAMLALIPGSNEKYGPQLCEKVSDDLATFLIGPDHQSMTIPAEMERYLSLLRNFLNETDDAFCAYLLRL